VDTASVYLIRRINQFLRGAIGSPEGVLNELLTVFIQKIECPEVGTGRNLDQLCEPISDLGSW
jgi:hypothetical protein